MTDKEDRQLTNEERAEITKRKLEIGLQKKTKQISSLTDLKKELGLSDQRKTK